MIKLRNDQSRNGQSRNGQMIVIKCIFKKCPVGAWCSPGGCPKLYLYSLWFQSWKKWVNPVKWVEIKVN